MSTTPGRVPPDVRIPSGAEEGSGGGYGWLVFAGIILGVAGVLNVIYGIAAIDEAQFFVADTHFVISDLKTWGWVALILGVMQIAAAFSLWAGNAFGRAFGIVAASLSMIGALLSIPAYPFWSLAIFALDILIIHRLSTYDPQRVR